MNSNSFTDGVPQSDRKKLVRLAKLIPNQVVLNTILLDVENPMQRGAVYDLLRPHLRFVGEYPNWVASHVVKKPDLVKQHMRKESAEDRAKKRWNVKTP